jgi:phosphohistidine phosphatase SixA
VLVRHAESERNVAKKGNRFFLDEEARKSVRGIADHQTPLTARGLLQASTTGIALRRDFGLFDYAYHSGYRRTRETLEHCSVRTRKMNEPESASGTTCSCGSGTPATPST